MHRQPTALTQAIEAHRAGQYADAIVLYERADGDPVLVLGGLAECRFYQGDYILARATCDVLNRKVANCGLAHHIRGLCYEKEAINNLAAEEYERAVRCGFRLSAHRLKRVRG